MEINYEDTLNIAYVLKNFFKLEHKVEPFGNDKVKIFYFEVNDNNIIVIDELEILSVNKILREIGYSIKVENDKLIIEEK